MGRTRREQARIIEVWADWQGLEVGGADIVEVDSDDTRGRSKTPLRASS